MHRNSKKLGVARVLLEYGALDANVRNANNATSHLLASGPFYCSDGELLDVVQLLLQYGSGIHARDHDGRTPFMKATAREYHDVIQ
jgi:ankyrin repeat protein